MRYFKLLFFLAILTAASAFGQSSNYYYKIANVDSGQLMGITDSSKTPGASVNQYTDVSAAAQLWQFIPTGKGTYYIVNANSGLYLEVLNASTALGAKMIQDVPNSSAAEQWQLTSNNGKYTFTNVLSTYVLDDDLNNINTPGIILQQWSSTGGSNQQWTLSQQGVVNNTTYIFNYSRTITVDHNQVGSGTNDENSFPLLVNVTDTGLKTTGNGGHIQSQTGNDIAFYSDSGLTQLLPFELISYDGSHGKVQAAVLINTLSHTSDTTIYMAYGSSTVVTSLQTPATVWKNYDGVYHLDDSGTGTGILNSATGDSTTANATVPANTVSATGQVGKGINLSATQTIDLGSYNIFNYATANSITISGWVKFSSLSDFASIFSDENSSGSGLQLSLSSSTLSGTTSNSDWAARYSYSNGQYRWTNGYGITPGTWYYFTAEYFHDPNGDDKLYINGIQQSMSNNNFDSSTLSVTQDLVLGGGVGTELDEVHISRNQLSTDWINTEYKNQSSATFLTLGAENNLNGSAGQITTKFPVTVVGVTATQAILSYVAPDNNACTIAVKDDISSNTVIHDLDPALYPGSNLDTRDGNFVNGTYRTIIIGHKTSDLAADGKMYSRALQAQTQETYAISCDNGYGATGTFTTGNIPVGDSSPRDLPFNSNGFGNYAWPTINFNDKTVKYIDPQTGVGLWRATGAPDDPGPYIATFPWTQSFDLSGGKWSNTGNLDNNGDGNVTTYSGNGGPQDALFVFGTTTQFRYGFNFDDVTATRDALLHLNGYGDSVSVCPTADQGQTCDSSNPLIYNMGGTSPVDNTGPNSNSFPSWGWATWGPNKISMNQLTNQYGGTLDPAQTTGSTLVWNGGSSAAETVYFPTTILKSGMKIWVPDSAPNCANNFCTIANNTSTPYNITINETLPSNWGSNMSRTLAATVQGGNGVTSFTINGTFPSGLYNPLGQIQVRIDGEDFNCGGYSGSTMTGCYSTSGDQNQIVQTHYAGATVDLTGWEIPAFGFKIWKNPGGTGSVSIDNVKVDFQTYNTYNVTAEGNGLVCSGQFPVAWDKNGNALATPVQGELCSMGDGYTNFTWYIFIPSTGELRRFSQARNGQTGLLPYNTLSYDASTGYFQQCTYDPNQPASNGGHFVDWSGTKNNGFNPAYSCNYIQTQYTVEQEVLLAHPELNLTYYSSGDISTSTEGFPDTSSTYVPQYTQYTDPQGVTHQYVMLNWTTGQDQRVVSVVLDLNQPPGAKQVISLNDSWSSYPQNWSREHGPFSFSQIPNTIMGGGLPLLAEQFNLQINKVYNNGTNDSTLPANFVDPAGCAGLGLTDPYWVSAATNWMLAGSNCIKMNITPSPYKLNPSTSDLGCDNLSGHCMHQGEITPFDSTEKPGGVAERVGPWPHNSKACNGDGSTGSCYGWLRDVKEGDWFVDSSSGTGQSSERFILAKQLNTLSDGTQDWIVLRAPAGPVQTDTGDCNTTPANHSNGWVGTMVPSVDCVALPIIWPIGQQPSKTNVTVETDNPYKSHVVIWTNSQGVDSRISAQGWATGSFPHKWGGYGQYGAAEFPPDQIYTNPDIQYPVNDVYPFDDNDGEMALYVIQSHPGGDKWNASAKENVWGLDGRPYGQAEGGNFSSAWAQTYSLVSGQSYTWKISDPTPATANWPQGCTPGSDCYTLASVHDIKRRRMVAFAGYSLLQDISGPNSSISDATPWSYCIAEIAGECVSGSQVNDMFVSVPNGDVQDNGCALDETRLAPCLTVAGPAEGAYTQFAMDKMDAMGSRFRVLTNGFGGPDRSNNFMNIHSFDPEGKYAVLQSNWVDGKSSEDFIVKLPTWPNEDSVLRNYFVRTPVTISGQTGTSARIRFGYNPSLYCVSRQDQCTTAPANGDPFAFASEPQSWTDTSDPTKTYKITIPTFANRILYYQIDRKDANGNVTSGPTQVMAIN